SSQRRITHSYPHSFPTRRSSDLDNPDILAKNAKAKAVDLSSLDFVVMSHRHGDHMGGLGYLLSVNPRVKIYAPRENSGVYGFSLPSAFYRKDESLPPEQRYYAGTPPP